MNTISNPLMQHQHLQAAANFRPQNSSKSFSSATMTSQQQQQIYHQAAAMNDLVRRHYAQTISRATNLSHLQLLNRYHQQQQHQQQLYQQPSFGPVDSPLSPIVQQKHQQQQQQQQQKYATHSQQKRAPVESLMSVIERQAMLNKPLCRCRVMYLGSSVPHITKNGLHGIQEPLRHLYPDEQFISGGGGSSSTSSPAKHSYGTNTINISHLSSDLGIDSWLSVWSNGLLLENVDEFGREIKRFFSIESLHYCAAVRFFDASILVKDEGLPLQKEPPLVQDTSDQNNNNNDTESSSTTPKDENCSEFKPDNQQQQSAPQPAKKSVVRFLPLDAPLFQCPGMVDAKHPPMFSAIMRRTSGIKVLECHAFICRRDAAANALVRCCTHAYADLLSARRMSSSSSSQFVDLQQFARQPSATAAHRQSYPHAGQHHMSLASRRGRHLDGGGGRHRRQHQPQQMDGCGGQDAVDAAGSQAAGVAARRKSKKILGGSHNSASSDDQTPSSLCNGGDNRPGDGTNSSGDDNYAIISRHQSRANSRGPPQSQPQDDSSELAVRARDKRSETMAASTSSTRGTARRGRAAMRAVGSSKSLFDDFMPNSRKLAATTKTTTNASSSSSSAAAAATTITPLSHSMDLLQLHQLDNGNGDCSASSCCGEQYGRRHSKSMQNLVDFTAAGGSSRQQRAGSFSSSRASLLSASSSRPGAGGASGGSARRRHRLHRSKRSLQDIRSHHQQQPDLIGNRPTGDPMRGERAAVNELQSFTGEQPAAAAAIYDKPTTTGSSNYYERIEARKAGSTSSVHMKKRDRSRTRANPGSSSTNTTRRVSSDASILAPADQHQHQHHHYPLSSAQAQAQSSHLQPPPPLPMGPLYAAPSLAHQFSAHHPALATVPMAYHPAAASMQPFEAAYYANTLLKYPPGGYCLPPPPPISYDGFHMPYAGQRHHHLAPHYTNNHPMQMAMPMPMPMHPMSVGAQLQNNNNNNNKMITDGSATLGHGKRKQHIGGGSSKSLATRFRCLSPPLNFITGGGGSSSSQETKTRNAISASLSPPPHPVAAAAIDTNTKSRESIAKASSISAEELNVVSAKPGFIIHSSVSNQTNDNNNNNNNNNTNPNTNTNSRANGKRLSWIKRLSLTMSGGSGSPAPLTDPAAVGEDPQAQDDDSKQQQKKRTSRLFVGSLTLGRTTRNKQQQQQQAAALVTSSPAS